jgi:hypothetical protein
VTSSMTPGRLPTVPNQPRTRAYSLRIDEERIAAIIAQGKLEGTNFSETIRNASDSYVGLKRDQDEEPAEGES